MPRQPRFLRPLRRLHARSAAAARRRPRRAALVVAALAVALVAGGTSVALLTRGQTAPAGGATGPTFTIRDGWSLAELRARIEAGEVVAITATHEASPAGAVSDRLLVRTADGRNVPIDEPSMAVADAVEALSALGYRDLLTAEALAVRPPARAGEPASALLGIGLPLVLLALTVILLWRLSRRGQPGRRDGSTFSTIMPGQLDGGVAGPGTSPAPGSLPVARLDDVAGCDEAKLELTETIDFLRSPERFRKLGARIPRGIMLYGPPGTGKTMLARAVAAEAGVPFHYASGSEFVEKYVGVGARRVRDLFAQARKLGRGVIFFDEFDALGKARGGPNSHEEREQTLNQLLVELDGFGTTDDVIVIAATNRLDTLDSAVLRPGRFNRKIHVGLPDVAGRRAILEVHARNKPIAGTVDLGEVARKTYGFSGAQLADLLNEAAILTARRSGATIEAEDLHGGWLKVAVGTSRRRSMDGRERSIIAAHEIGHAICGKVHGDRRRVEEISLFAHGEALGVTVSSQEDNDLPSESDLRARLVALMGGRAAEELLFHEVTGGASNDFEAANRIASAMVTKWGMGRDPDATDHGISGRGSLSFLVPTGGRSLPSDVQAAATRAIRAILDEAYAEACRTLVEQMETLRRLAAYLVEHERVDGATFDELFDGRRPVTGADDEWRAATSRPRDWAEVVDLAAARRVRPAELGATVAAVAPATELGIDPAAVAATAAQPALDGGSPVPLDPAAISRETTARWRRRPAPQRRSPARAPFAGRRIRHTAAGLLTRAAGWLRASESKSDSL